MRRPWSAFRKTTWVLARPYVLAGAVFVFFFSLINYAVPYQFSIGGILPSEIHSQYQAHHNHGQAAALTVPFVFASLLLLWAERRTVRRGAVVRGRTATDAAPIRLGFTQPLAQAFVAVDHDAVGDRADRGVDLDGVAVRRVPRCARIVSSGTREHRRARGFRGNDRGRARDRARLVARARRIRSAG